MYAHNGVEMIKRRFNLWLPGEITDRVKEKLGEKKISLSGFLSLILEEYDKELQGQENFLNKPLEEMTVKEVLDYMSLWAKRIREIQE